jgi:hypothetical protein
MKQIIVNTNFNQLNKGSQEKIFSDLGRSLAQIYIDRLKVLPIDSVVQAAKLKLNKYEATNNDTETSSQKLQTSQSECSSNKQKHPNTHLPLNENNKFSRITESQNKD